MSDLDAFLAECDDVITDWEGSADSAEWTADGSHEHDTTGRYYAEDGFAAYERAFWAVMRRQMDDAFERVLAQLVTPPVELLSEAPRYNWLATSPSSRGTSARHVIYDEARALYKSNHFVWASPISAETATLLSARSADPMDPPTPFFRRRSPDRFTLDRHEQR